MAKLEKFEDLMAWQKARELAQAVYRVTREGGWSKDRRLTEQIQGAAVAVMTYTANGFERWEPAESLALLADAKAAATDVKSCLYVALDAGYMDGKTFDDLRAQADSVARIIGGWRGSKEKRLNGNQPNDRSGNGSNYDDSRRPAYQGR